MKFGATTVLTG